MRDARILCNAISLKNPKKIGCTRPDPSESSGITLPPPPATKQGGENAVGGPQKRRKIAEIAELAEKLRKIAALGKENCGWDLKKFSFPDSEQGKGRQKITVQTKPNPSRKK